MYEAVPNDGYEDAGDAAGIEDDRDRHAVCSGAATRTARPRVPAAPPPPRDRTVAASGARNAAILPAHTVERDGARRSRYCAPHKHDALADDDDAGERRPLGTQPDSDSRSRRQRIHDAAARADDINEQRHVRRWLTMAEVMEDGGGGGGDGGVKDLNERLDGNAHCNGRMLAAEEWTQQNGGVRRGGDDGGRCERVDVDHIKLEHCRHKTQNVGVQTTHLSPYRLRLWPVPASIKCLDASFVDVAKCCLRTLSQWFLSQVGLTCVLIVWALLGATAFYKTEGPREREQAEQINHYKIDISIDLATDLRQLKEGSEKWPETIQKYLHKHENLLLHALSSGYVEGGGSIWTYPGCVLFAVLLLTTLGFGAPVPRTSLGRGMAVLFSAFGIPLHFVLILNASSLIAKCLRNLATIKPAGEPSEARTTRRMWYKWFPPMVALLYYLLGVIGFGVLRQRSVVECLLFALDFTESGGVANTAGHVRILYALYIEVAVILAATIMSIVQVSATSGIIDLGLRLGLLTNT